MGGNPESPSADIASPSSTCSSSPFELIDAMTPHQKAGSNEHSSTDSSDSGKENAAFTQRQSILYLQEVVSSVTPVENLLNSPLFVNTVASLPSTPKLSAVGPTWSLSRKNVTPSSTTRQSTGSINNYSNSSSSRSSTGSISKRGQAMTTPNTGCMTLSPAQSQKVNVAVRIRPFLASEMAAGSRRVVSMHPCPEDAAPLIQIVNPYIFDADREAVAAAAAATDKKHWAQSFKFNKCIWSFDHSQERGEDGHVDGVQGSVSQEGVYSAIGADMVDSGLNGQSTCCFAYGYAATGKSYSLFGDLTNSSRTTSSSPALGLGAGLIPRVFTALVTSLQARNESDQDTRMTLSFLEIYNEKIRDLLSDADTFTNDNLRVREHPQAGPYVEGLTKVIVTSVADLLRLLQLGVSRRASMASSLSSRSHAIVTLELSPRLASSANSPATFRNVASRLGTSSSLRMSLSGPGSLGSPGEVETEYVRLQFVDLAGSSMESAAPTAAASTVEKAELKMIRRSLSTLTYIIRAIGKGCGKTLPFRDSTLTWILRDALSGYCHMTMLATVAPSDSCYEETLNTLKCAWEVSVANKKSATEKRRDVTTTSIAEGGNGKPENNSDDKISSAPTDNPVALPLGLPASAARQLLKETISDPQQKVAKQVAAAAAASLNSRSKTAPTKQLQVVGDAANTTSIEQLRNHYRDLHGRYVELQIELETARTDRDSIMLQLATTREAVEIAKRGQSGDANRANSYADTAAALLAAQKDLNELKGILVRKEEAVDSLLEDLRDEKQGRAIAEHTLEVQAHEFLDRIGRMQSHIKELEGNVANTKLMADATELRADNTLSQYSQLQDKCDALTSTVQRLETDLRKAKQESQEKAMELIASESISKGSEVSFREINRVAERLRADLALITAERDSLKRLAEAQENAIKMQHKSSETSLKVLQDRQAALERLEQANTPVFEELSRLQNALQNHLQREGSALATEIHDARQLTIMLSTMREKMEESVSGQVIMVQKLEEERAARAAAELELGKTKQKVLLLEDKVIQDLSATQQAEEVKQQLLQENIATLQQQLKEAQAAAQSAQKVATQWEHAAMQSEEEKQYLVQESNSAMQQQLLEAKAAAQTAQMMASQWEEAAMQASAQLQQSSSKQNVTDELASMQLENARLRNQVSSLQHRLPPADAGPGSDTRKEELASLWNAVEELSSIDAIKEKMIQELLGEKEAFRSQLDIVKADYRELHRELEVSCPHTIFN